MTPFIDVYEMFLGDIQDNDFIDMGMEDPMFFNEKLYDYLSESADLYFRKCKKDLSKRDEDSFHVELSEEEKRILAKGMKVKWLISNFTAPGDLAKTHLFTKDYKLFSPANRQKAIMDIQKETKKELHDMIIRYLYSNWVGG